MPGDRYTGHARVASPGKVTPFAIRLLVRVLHPVVRVAHRASLEGAEQLPPPSAFMLVSNHPPALGGAELVSFAAVYAKAFGGERPLAGFAHAASFGWWPLSWLFRHIGAIPSTYEAARDALGEGVPLVLFPGGDVEGFRPFWRAREVDFGGRIGFLRIAREAWVPVVPMATRGCSTPLLFGASWLAYLAIWPRLVGVKRYAISVLGLFGALAILWSAPLELPLRALLAWAWMASPLSLLSWWPTRVTIRIGKPMAPEDLFGERGAPSDDAELHAAREKIETAITRLLHASRS